MGQVFQTLLVLLRCCRLPCQPVALFHHLFKRCWRSSGFTTLLFGGTYFRHCVEIATLIPRRRDLVQRQRRNQVEGFSFLWNGLGETEMAAHRAQW